MMTSLVSLQQRNVKKSKKSMKTVYIVREKYSCLLNDMRNFNEIFRKDVAYDNIESRKKKQHLILFLENTFFEKPQGGSFCPPSSLFSVNYERF